MIVDEVWLNQYQDKIGFWSFSLIKANPDSKASKFRVFTKKQYIPLKKVKSLMKTAFPKCTVIPCFGYRYTHTFDVRMDKITWREFIWNTVNALGDYL